MRLGLGDLETLQGIATQEHSHANNIGMLWYNAKMYRQCDAVLKSPPA